MPGVPNCGFCLEEKLTGIHSPVMATEPFETAFASGFPAVTQLSIFFDNRVGQLARLTRLFEETEIHILAISVVHSVDCGILRMIVDKPDDALDLLNGNNFAVHPTEILVVSMPPGKRALLHTWVAFLSAEVNVSYAYALLCPIAGRPALAVQADQLEQAADALRHKGFTVLDQSDLQCLE